MNTSQRPCLLYLACAGCSSALSVLLALGGDEPTRNKSFLDPFQVCNRPLLSGGVSGTVTSILADISVEI